MKKLLALLLAVVLLVGCSNTDPKEKLYGIWTLGGINYNGSYFTVEELDEMGGYYISTYYKDEYFILKNGGAAVLYDRSWDITYLREWKFENGKLIINDKDFILTDNGEIECEYSDDYNLVYKKLSTSQDMAELKKMINGDEYEEEIQSTDTITSSSESIRPEFKQTMDDYERFFDSYVEFMKEFNSSDNVLSMMDEYLDFLNKYSSSMDSMDELENSDLNDEELKYYTEVTLRIEEKLLSAI